MTARRNLHLHYRTLARVESQIGQWNTPALSLDHGRLARTCRKRESRPARIRVLISGPDPRDSALRLFGVYGTGGKPLRLPHQIAPLTARTCDFKGPEPSTSSDNFQLNSNSAILQNRRNRLEDAGLIYGIAISRP